MQGKLYFITGNQNKFDEIKALLPQVEQLDMDLPEIQGIDPEVVLTAKLQEAIKQHDGEFMVEDTSLFLDCLNGLPGPLIKWFMKTMGNEGLFEIAKRFGNYEATAKVVIGYINKDKEISFFDGQLNGKIVEPRGGNGFGWDPIFEVKGKDKTFAEMTQEEKNRVSMRKIAVEKLSKFLS